MVYCGYIFKHSFFQDEKMDTDDKDVKKEDEEKKKEGDKKKDGDKKEEVKKETEKEKKLDPNQEKVMKVRIIIDFKKIDTLNKKLKGFINKISYLQGKISWMKILF